MIRPVRREDLRELWELEKLCFSDPWSLQHFHLQPALCNRYVPFM